MKSFIPHRLIGLTSVLLLGLMSGSTVRAQNDASSVRLPGYEGVAFRYGPMNKMLMRAEVNGHPATFIVDTGASVSVLERRRAQAWGVSAVAADSKFGEFAALNGKPFRVGYVSSLKAGGMDFGGG